MAKFSEAFLNRLGTPGLLEKGLMQAAGGLAGVPNQMMESNRAGEVQQLLQQHAHDPRQLTIIAQKYQSEGNERFAKMFFDAAKAATAKNTAGQQRGIQGGLTAITQAASRGTPLEDLREAQNSVLSLGGSSADIMEAYKAGLELGKKPERNTANVPAGGTIVDTDTGDVIYQAPFKPTEPKAPKIDIKESEGEFVVFENGVEVRRYDTPAKAGAAAAELKKANGIITKAQGVQLKIDDALGMIDETGFVGGWAGLLKYLPDTEARRFEGLITSVKANVGFDQLLAIKEGGSTLGQVSNIENLLLQSTIDSLDTLTSKEDLKQALNRIDAYYTSLITKTQYGEDAPLKDWAGTVEWTNPEFARMYEQSGGEIVINEQEGTVLVKSPSGEMVKLLVDR
jgi:hypothetical protein